MNDALDPSAVARQPTQQRAKDRFDRILQAAETLLTELPKALAPQGAACLYGPFLRGGRATSAGDTAFDASLRAQDPAIGYKDLDWVKDRLTAGGLAVRVIDMPANNLTLVARQSKS